MATRKKPETLEVPLRWIRSLGPTQAALLAFLASRSERDAEADGWFVCPAKHIRQKLKFTTRTQTRLIDQLRQKGRLEVRSERIGPGTLRKLRIKRR